jgi:hypothetical protein
LTGQSTANTLDGGIFILAPAPPKGDAVYDSLGDPNAWGGLAAVCSLPLAFASFTLFRRRVSSTAPDGLLLLLAAVACGMSSLGVYTTVIDGDGFIYVALRVITLVYCTLVLVTIAGHRYLGKPERRTGYSAID